MVRDIDSASGHQTVENSLLWQKCNLKWHYVETGILCDLLPPNKQQLQTKPFLLMMLSVENLYITCM